VELVHVIRHKVLVEKRPIRAVAREMGMHRDTVRGYVRGGPPTGRRQASERKRPLRDAVEGRVEAIVDGAAGKTTEKQRLTAKRIQSMLNDGEDGKEAVDVGYTLVKEIFREIWPAGARPTGASRRSSQATRPRRRTPSGLGRG